MLVKVLYRKITYFSNSKAQTVIKYVIENVLVWTLRALTIFSHLLQVFLFPLSRNLPTVAQCCLDDVKDDKTLEEIVIDTYNQVLFAC